MNTQRKPRAGVCWYCSRSLPSREPCTRSSFALGDQPTYPLRVAHAVYPDGYLGTTVPRPWEDHERALDIDAFVFQDFTRWPDLLIPEISVDNWTVRPVRVDHGRFWILEMRNRVNQTRNEFPFELPTAEHAEQNARDIANWVATAMEFNDPFDVNKLLNRVGRMPRRLLRREGTNG